MLTFLTPISASSPVRMTANASSNGPRALGGSPATTNARSTPTSSWRRERKVVRSSWDSSRRADICGTGVKPKDLTSVAVATRDSLSVIGDYLSLHSHCSNTNPGRTHPRAPVHSHFFQTFGSERGLVFLDQLLIERCRRNLGTDFMNLVSLHRRSPRVRFAPTHKQIRARFAEFKIHDRERQHRRSIGTVANVLGYAGVLSVFYDGVVLKC